MLPLLLLLSGCSSFRTQMGHPLPATAKEFVHGQTRVENVLEKLGPPNTMSRLPQGFGLLYEYTRVSEFQLGFSVNYSFLRYFKFIRAWNRLEEQALLLTFDDHGLLRSASSGQSKQSMGGGSAVQAIVSVMSLSDVSRFLRPADAHSWGESLLKDPPEMLNSANSLRTGEQGLQQRLTLQFAGQGTLEMAAPVGEKAKKRIKRNYQMNQPTQ